jgi:transposase
MLGIDVSKKTLSCTLLDPTTQRIRWSRDVANTAAGLASLVKRAPADVPWVLEPTGRYSNLAVQTAHAAGRQVLLAPTRRAKHFLASVQNRAKTDRLDSYGLACFALARPLRPYPVKSPALEQLDQLQTARRGLVRALTQLQQQARELPAAAAGLEPALVALRAQLAAFDRQIAAGLKAAAGAELTQNLQAVPGIGPVTAAAVLSCLLGKGFTHPDQFVAYIGLDTKVRESGLQRGRRRLSKQGPGELRSLLYLAAQSNLRIAHSPFRAQYEREKAKGLPTTGALCAVARKMARLCWSLVQHGSKYDAERVYQAPSPRKCNQPSSAADLKQTLDREP